MKVHFLRLIFAATALATPLHAEYREWSNSEGVKIDAEFVKAEGDDVTLRLRNGRSSTFPQAKLSLADRDFIKEALSAPAPEPQPSVDLDRKARWLDKMEKAQEESRETGLPILVLFTGTSWCPYCIKLEKAVFSERSFKSFANQNLVLLMFDFDSGGDTRSRDAKKLQKEFGVKGYPTYFLTDSSGTQLARGGYRNGITPDSFATWVNSSVPKK